MTTTLKIPQFAEQSWEFDQSTSDQLISVWTAFMRIVLKSHSTSRRHYLFIDGLDDLGPLRENHGMLLTGLITASRDLNNDLRRENTNIKVVICCRTDLYERLELPMKGKIRSDFGIDLDWYQDPREIAKTHLVQLANQRAQLSGYRGDLFARSFPARLDKVPTAAFLTRATRHTPRDFHALLRNIQDAATGNEPLTRDQILTGMRNYSLIYFRDEMDDALDSYFESKTKQRILDGLGRLRSATFTRDDFSGLLEGVNADSAVEALFECGFVGAVSEDGRAPYYRFAYRNPAVRVANLDKLQLLRGCGRHIIWLDVSCPESLTAGCVAGLRSGSEARLGLRRLVCGYRCSSRLVRPRRAILDQACGDSGTALGVMHESAQRPL